MRLIQVVDRQNLIDIAVQYYGSAASVIDLCIDNSLELDTDIQPGDWLQIQDTYPDSADGDVADYISGNNIVVVSMSELAVVEDDGDYLIDNDGNFIIDNDDDFIVITGGGIFMDNDGDFIIDNDNNFITLQ